MCKGRGRKAEQKINRRLKESALHDGTATEYQIEDDGWTTEHPREDWWDSSPSDVEPSNG